MTRNKIAMLVLFAVFFLAGLFFYNRGTRESGVPQRRIANPADHVDAPEGRIAEADLKDRQNSAHASDLRGGELLDESLEGQSEDRRNSARASDFRGGELQDESLGGRSKDRRNLSYSSLSSQALIDILHNDRDGTLDFYIEARRILTNPGIDASEKQELIHVLNRAATPEAIRLIAELIQEGAPDELKLDLYEAISMVGEYFWDREDVYQTSDSILMLLSDVQDQNLLNALTRALGNIGDETSLNILFDTAFSQEGNLETLRNSNDPAVTAALAALQRIHNPDSAPIITDRLTDSTNSAEIALCAGILDSIQEPVGTQYLLSWAQNADYFDASLILDVFWQVSPPGLDYLRTINVRNLDFRSDDVKNSVLAALDARL